MAAHHIANLPADEELRIIEREILERHPLKHFHDLHFTYERSAIFFQTFPCPAVTKAIAISDVFLDNRLQCLRLYRCFHEAGDVDICKTIERSVTFSDKMINVGGTTLTATDVECVTIFLTSSFHKEWV